MANNPQPPEVRFDDMKLSVGRVGRTVNELYTGDEYRELRELCLWLHGYCLKVRHVWKKAMAMFLFLTGFEFTELGYGVAFAIRKSA